MSHKVAILRTVNARLQDVKRYCLVPLLKAIVLGGSFNRKAYTFFTNKDTPEELALAQKLSDNGNEPFIEEDLLKQDPLPHIEFAWNNDQY